MSRKCIFCDSANDLTGEHGYPKWFFELFPEGIITVQNLSDPRQKWSFKRTRKGKHKHAIVANVVCKPCNTGWMANLEGLAKPILVPLIKGERVTLDRRQQALLTVWTVKTCMVHEHVGAFGHPSRFSRYFTREERHTMRNILWVPPGTFLWLGRYEGAWSARYEDRNLMGTLKDTVTGAVEAKESYVATLTLGKLALQLLQHRWGENRPFSEIVRMSTRTPQWRLVTTQIYPFVREGVTWPPFAMNDAALEAFRIRFEVPPTAPIMLN